MSDCPECGVINYGINPRCASCVRKVMLERIKELEDVAEAAEGALDFIEEWASHTRRNLEKALTAAGYPKGQNK